MRSFSLLKMATRSIFPLLAIALGLMGWSDRFSLPHLGSQYIYALLVLLGITALILDPLIYAVTSLRRDNESYREYISSGACRIIKRMREGIFEPARVARELVDSGSAWAVSESLAYYNHRLAKDEHTERLGETFSEYERFHAALSLFDEKSGGKFQEIIEYWYGWNMVFAGFVAKEGD